MSEQPVFQVGIQVTATTARFTDSNYRNTDVPPTQMFTWKHKTKTNELLPSLDTDFGGQGLWMT